MKIVNVHEAKTKLSAFLELTSFHIGIDTVRKRLGTARARGRQNRLPPAWAKGTLRAPEAGQAYFL